MDVKSFKSYLKEFLNRKHTRDMLLLFDNKNLSGWEKWVQFEFFKFLSDKKCEIYAEDIFDINGQTKSNKTQNRIDIVYRDNGNIKYNYTAVELKLFSNHQNSIKGLLSDLNGIKNIKSSDWSFRSVFGVAFFSTQLFLDTKEETKYKKFIKKSESKFKSYMFSVSGWYCVVIGWEAPTKNVDAETNKLNKKLYDSFIKNLIASAQEEEIYI